MMITMHRDTASDHAGTTTEQPISLQIAATMEKIIEKNILPRAGHVKGKSISATNQCICPCFTLGNLLSDMEKYSQVAQYKDKCYRVYLAFCTKNKVCSQRW
jgi:hypothetical protein